MSQSPFWKPIIPENGGLIPRLITAILYLAPSGCQWCLLPGEFPPLSTVQHYFYNWRDSGLLATINHHLVMVTRELERREASPTAGAIDNQSFKTTECGGLRGYDGGKKIKGANAISSPTPTV